MVEDTASQGEQIDIRVAAAAGRNIGRRGADIMTGDLVARGGDVLTPGRIGSAISTSPDASLVLLFEHVRRVQVERRRRVRIRAAKFGVAPIADSEILQPP